MARTKQQLINYHTSSKTNMPLVNDVQFGEIVVRHNEKEPQLLIKVNSAGTEVFVPFIASAAVSTAISAAIEDAEGTINSDISSLSGSIGTLSGSVVNNYYTSAETKTKIGEALTTAKNYADSQDDALSGRVVNYISTAVTNNLKSLKDAIDTNKSDITKLKEFSGVVETTYATKAYADAESAAAVSTVVGASTDTKDADTVYGAKAYANDAVKTLSGNVVTYVDTQVQTAKQSTSDLSDKVTQLSGSVISMSADVKNYIDTELSTVYDYKGSVATVNDLPAEGKKVGDVYNVVAAQGTPGTSDFVPAGTNYAWDGAKWDALGGTVDLSNYTTTATTKGLNDRIEALETDSSSEKGRLDAVSGFVNSISATVTNNYATKTYADNSANASAQSALTRANAYTDTQVKGLSGNVVTYVNGIKEGLDNTIADIKSNYALSSVTHNEIETAKTTVIGTSADTKTADTIYGAKAYADDAVAAAKTELIGTASESANTLGELEAKIDAIANGSSTDLGALINRVASLEGSATTWNEKTATAIQGGKLGTVSETTEGNGVTIQSGAKMKQVAGGDITLDLSELVINCGDF